MQITCAPNMEHASIFDITEEKKHLQMTASVFTDLLLGNGSFCDTIMYIYDRVIVIFSFFFKLVFAESKT